MEVFEIGITLKKYSNPNKENEMGWLSNLIAKIKTPEKTIQDIKDRVTNCPFMSDKDKKALLKIIAKYLD